MSVYLTFNDRLRKLRRDVSYEWEKLHGENPETLYHYTNSQGLIGILGYKSMWASNVCFLNDSKELVHGRETVLKVLDETISAHPNEPVRGFLSDFRERVCSGQLEMDVYAVCFCEEGDVLSQWRAYGAMGDGYSIGLCADSLKRLSQHPDFHCKLRKVIYDAAKQLRLVADTVWGICDLLEEACSKLAGAELDKLLCKAKDNLDWQLKEYLYCFKYPAFSEEREWRLVHLCPATVYNQTLQFRTSKGKIIPYLSLPLFLPSADGELKTEQHIPLKQVIYGAVLAQQTTQKSLNHLLRFHKYEHIEPIHSTVPLVI